MTGGTLCVRLGLNHSTNLHILFANQFNISFVLTMTSADSSQGHTQHQISLNCRVHVLYISIASLGIAQYTRKVVMEQFHYLPGLARIYPLHADSPSHLVENPDDPSITELVS